MEDGRSKTGVKVCMVLILLLLIFCFFLLANKETIKDFVLRKKTERDLKKQGGDKPKGYSALEDGKDKI